jgi:hypothetical protein
MEKTFKLGVSGDQYKVLINRNKKVNIQTGTEEINFFFGNVKYANAEEEYLTNFLEHRLAISKATEIKNYILSKILVN